MPSTKLIINLSLQYMTNNSLGTSAHLVITGVIGIVVTALCCYAFYIFRTGSARETSLTDAMKVVRSATEIVASMAEKGLPAIRSKLEEIESRARLLERKITASSGSVAASAPPPPPSDVDLLAARKAARGGV